MAKRYIEINKILNFSKTILNKKNLNYKDFVFNHKDQCLRKILVLTNFKAFKMHLEAHSDTKNDL